MLKMLEKDLHGHVFKVDELNDSKCCSSFRLNLDLWYNIVLEQYRKSTTYLTPEAGKDVYHSAALEEKLKRVPM